MSLRGIFAKLKLCFIFEHVENTEQWSPDNV